MTGVQTCALPICPARVQSLGGKKYILVVVDDFTRYTWVVLFKDRAEAPEKMIHLCKKL